MAKKCKICNAEIITDIEVFDNKKQKDLYVNKDTFNSIMSEIKKNKVKKRAFCKKCGRTFWVSELDTETKNCIICSNDFFYKRNIK